MTDWPHLSDDELLKLRIRDLELTLSDSMLLRCIDRLHEELHAQQCTFLPTCYLGDEWCVYEDSPAICIPFYLAHPRLKQLEQRMMLEVEGADETTCMKLLRHECGHAYMYAYGLHTRPKWRKAFGDPRKPYHDSGYRPRPYSKNYVRHLDRWYAQCHPDEDFAETFAVWLNPESEWQHKYRQWPAFRKLLYVDQLIPSLAERPLKVQAPRRHQSAIQTLSRKLATHYQRRRKEYAHEAPDLFDRDLRSLFPDTASRSSITAAQYLRRNRKDIVQRVAQWTGEHKYFINELLRAIITRCQELRLRCTEDDTALRENILMYISIRTMNHVHTGYYKDPTS